MFSQRQGCMFAVTRKLVNAVKAFNQAAPSATKEGWEPRRQRVRTHNRLGTYGSTVICGGAL